MRHESPVLSSFEFVPVGNDLLADMDDGPWLGLETWNDVDDAGWQWAAGGGEAAGKEGSLMTCDFADTAAWDFVEMVGVADQEG
jgi:hypothetical protein